MRKTGFRLPASGFRLGIAAWLAAGVAVSAAFAADSVTEAKSAKRPPRKVLRLEELTVEGRIQKPQAFFILQRNNLAFDEPEKKESFLPRIVKSCGKDPF